MNQGLGEVVEKNTLLLSGCFQSICANRHANGRDWWLLAGDNQADTFYRFLVTPDTILGPWLQAIENPFIDEGFFCGWNCFSPDGRYYAVNSCIFGVAVYDFDRCTGLLSNLRFDPRPSWDYTFGAAFSPDSRYLYVESNSGKALLQYDLSVTNFAGAKDTVAIWDGFFDVFGSTIFGFSILGPDGKIYIGSGDNKYVHIVEYPNKKGADCTVVQRAIEFPTQGKFSGMYHPNYRLGPLDDSSCDTLGLDNLPSALFRYEPVDTADPLTLQFTDLSWYEPDTWYWTFGDGAISQDTNPAHTFPWPGIYTVCLVVSNEYASDTLCQQIEVGEVSGVPALPALPLAQVNPNPFGEALWVSLPARVALSPRFVLRDALGRVCLDEPLAGFEHRIATGHLPPGLYFWSLQYGGRVVQAGKVAKGR